MFFYTDNIVFAFLIKRLRMMEVIMAELKKRYNLTGGGNLYWFLGIEIIRNRCRGYVILIQRVNLKRFRKDYSININPITLII